MFRIGENATHGHGWIALRNIAADTPILDEEAAIQVHSSQCTNSEVVDTALLRLSDSERESFLTLYGGSPVDKLHKNSMPLLGLDADWCDSKLSGMVGVCLKCARLNHSCRPTAARAIGEDGVVSVIAQKNIAAGEEITISYLDDNFLGAAARSRRLQSMIQAGDTCFSNGCQCKLCCSDEAEKMESDARREKLASHRERLLDGKLSKESLISLMSLMAQEDLFMALIGVPAAMKLAQAVGIGKNQNPGESISPGNRVCVYKLRTKPELNGLVGIVVSSLNASTGRVGVQLDSNTRTEPIAVKPDNLCLMSNEV